MVQIKQNLVLFQTDII